MDALDRPRVERWVAGYEGAWRSPGTEALTSLFSPDVSYLPSPWAKPVEGFEQLAAFWDAEREGHDEPFTMTTSVVAVEGQTAVVRVSVEYLAELPERSRWRDLWVVQFDRQGRCERFEEWPFAPTPT